MTAPREEAKGRRISRARLVHRVRDALASGDLVVTAGAGCGKTTILEEALPQVSESVAWVSCSDTERVPGTLLMRIVREIARAAPGPSDVIAERLVSGPERIDALATARELLADLSRLLVEPLVLAIDDGEHLDGADDSLRLLDELIRAEVDLLHVAIASRRRLELRVAKPRAAGRLTELTAADLVFDAEECAAVLQGRTGVEPSPEQVDELMSATEGWPLGIALAAEVVARGAQRGSLQLPDLRSAPALRGYFSEEVLDSLDPELREAAIESSVCRTVTPEVARALNLPEDFENRIQAAGVLVRHVDEVEGLAYHPLIREFLHERLAAERGEEERRRLHAAVAPAVSDVGDEIGAIEHWLEAQSWVEAVGAIEREGMALVRTSPEMMRHWLELLPPDVRGLPTMRALEGQLEWGAGDNAKAIEAFRDAVHGFDERPNAPADWIARSMLVDSLFATGEVDELEKTVEGWDQPEAEAAGGLGPAAAMYAAICLAGYGRFEDSDRLAAAANQHPESEFLVPLEALRLAFRDGPRGQLDEIHAALTAAGDEMERFDPLSRRPHVLGARAALHGERGRREEALRMWIEIREEARTGLVPVLADATHAWCALLHAQAGRLAEAEAELAQHRRKETGYRAFIADLAPAVVAALRGDAEATLSAAERALASVSGGPIMFRYWVGVDLVPALVAVGRMDYAEWVLDDTVAAADEIVPGPSGRLVRGRLFAARAWLRHVDGDEARADEELRAFWEEANGAVGHIIRREWERLESVLWSGLERGALEPEAVIGAIAEAFPEGLQLVPFMEHPVAAVRKAALVPAARSGDPRALARVTQLVEDPDRDLAHAASRAADRLEVSMPPLRFAMLGKFAVRRGSWQAAEDAWGRPIDARLVRFLLVNLGQPVPEDLILEALWPGLSASNAKRSLRVAVSRARKVLDAPGAERSVIEGGERSYRLALGDRDVVDAEHFQSAAETALAEPGDQRRALLERTRSLWGGEPLPEERYSDWAAPYRERLTDRYIAVLSALIEIDERAGKHAYAVDAARELVELDPLNEAGHRSLIVAYARIGRRGHALRQYLECRRALVEELGVEPSDETSRMQARILAGEAV
jgi:DNA-binding SARP family transcriptional activator